MRSETNGSVPKRKARLQTGLLRGLGVSPIQVDACADVADLIGELRA